METYNFEGLPTTLGRESPRHFVALPPLTRGALGAPKGHHAGTAGFREGVPPLLKGGAPQGRGDSVNRKPFNDTESLRHRLQRRKPGKGRALALHADSQGPLCRGAHCAPVFTGPIVQQRADNVRPYNNPINRRRNTTCPAVKHPTTSSRNGRNPTESRWRISTPTTPRLTGR